MAESISSFSRLAVNGTKICFGQFRNDTVHQLVDAGDVTMCGDLDHDARLVTGGVRVIRFTIVCSPTPEELSVMLPLMGLEQDGGDPTLYVYSSSLPEFTVVVDKVAKVHTYSGCKVNRWAMRGQTGRQPWALELHCVGKTESLGSSFSFSPPATKTAPYAFHQGVLVRNSVTYQFDRFVLAANHKLAVSFNNSETATDIQPTDHELVFGVTEPYNADGAALYETDTGASRVAGYSATLTFSRTNIQTQFQLANIKTEAQPPSILHRSPIKLDRFYRAYKTSTNPSIKVVHDDDASS